MCKNQRILYRHEQVLGRIRVLEWPIASEAASESTSRSTSEASATKTTKTSRSFVPTSASATSFTTSSVTIAKEVQTIADVQHSIAVDGVNLTIAPAIGIDCS